MSKSSKHFMRVISFIIVAILVSALSFLGTHPAYVFLAVILSLPVAVILLAISYAEWPYSWGQTQSALSPRANRRNWMIVGAGVALTLSVAATHWPLRLSYFLSKTSLNRVAAQVASGTKTRTPQSAGVFSVVQADKDNGLVCLWISEDRGEPIGFIQGSPGKIQAGFSDYDIIVLDGDWCLVSSL